jgi:hypothetical protein
MNRSALFIALLLSIAVGQGCKPRLLPSTNVAPTRENKRIVGFLENYKMAVERRSVESIMELVAKDFKDNMGSEDPSNHIDYLALKDRLEKTMPRIQDLRLGLFVQRIAKVTKDTYEIIFYFNKHALTEVPSGEKWIVMNEVNRMVIRKRHDKNAPYEYEILQGI